MKDPKALANEMFQFEMFEMFQVEDITFVLQAADDLYFNTGEDSFLTDPQYDALRLYASKTYPTHKYFLGVGTEVRGGKVDLPYPMGSLDQVQIGEIQGWVKKWTLHDAIMVMTDKLDGTSALVIYDNAGRLQIAYSRGNGIQGADITRHIRHLVPPKVDGPMVVRGEVIIPISAFDQARKIAKTRSGDEYKNARNMVAGLMNASKNPHAVYQHIHFVAYDILDQADNELSDKDAMLMHLEDNGFLTPYYLKLKGSFLTDDNLANYLKDRRDQGGYEIDGIVIDANDMYVREDMNPTRDTLNPGYSIKYKVADASNLARAIVVAVHWALSKHGYLKPRIEIEPVDLVGVTITYCTGFNAKFIADNKIGPGAEIEVTRSGDVIPYCQKVIKGTTAQMPGAEFEDWGYSWVGDEVDIQLHNHWLHPEVQIQQMVDFFSSIEAPLLKEGSVRKLHEAGYCTIEGVIALDENELRRVLGSNGAKVYQGLRKALTDIPLYKLVGAHSMERGIGVRSMKSLQDDMGRDALLDCTDMKLIAKQHGFNDTTAELVIRALGKFRIFLADIEDYVTIAQEKDTSSGALAGKKVVFTGFRDKTLAAQVEDAGGTMQSSVSGKTNIVVTTNPSGNSSKLRKARDLGIDIVSVNDIRGML